MANFIQNIANVLQMFFFGDYWFVTMPIALLPVVVLVFLEIKHTIATIKKQKENNKKRLTAK